MAQAARGLIGLLALGGIALIIPFYAGHLDGRLIAPVYVTLILLIGFLHFSFLRASSNPVLVGLHGIASLAALGWLASSLLDIPSLPSLGIPENFVFIIPRTFLPSWWISIPLIPILVLLAVDFLPIGKDDTQRPAWSSWPSTIEEIPESPLALGLTFLVIGAWGILFVIGISFIQRLIVIAPIFEELAKLGTALLLASLLAIRTPVGAYALGLLSGFAFGILEHFHSYPTEMDISLVARVTFHAALTGLAIATYFHYSRQRRPQSHLLLMAPVIPIFLHAAHNFFAIIFGVLIAAGLLNEIAGAYSSGILSLIAIGVAIRTMQGNPFDRLHEWFAEFLEF